MLKQKAQIATPCIAAKAAMAAIYTREIFSDHAPVVGTTTTRLDVTNARSDPRDVSVALGDSEERPRRLLDEIVVDHRDEPALVLRFTEVSVMPARALPPELAGRRPFLERGCARIGREPDDDMPVACARFELLFATP